MSKKIGIALVLGTFLAGTGAVGVTPSFAAGKDTSKSTASASDTTPSKGKKHHAKHSSHRKAAPKTEAATPSK